MMCISEFIIDESDGPYFYINPVVYVMLSGGVCVSALGCQSGVERAPLPLHRIIVLCYLNSSQRAKCSTQAPMI